MGCGGLEANWWWKVKGWMGRVVGRWSLLYRTTAGWLSEEELERPGGAGGEEERVC